jgi:hypothetical protein
MLPIMAEPESPNPQYDVQEQELKASIERSAQAVTLLREVGMEREAAIFSIRALTEFSNRAHTMARTLGMQAIADGQLSRKEVAREMGVHQSTVAVWYKEAQTDPGHDYAAEPLRAVQPHTKQEAG